MRETINKSSSQKRYAEIVESLTGIPSVSFGSPTKKGFGSAQLQVNGKIFAMLSSKEQFVVKLPKHRVEALIAAGQGERFDPGHGRLMKEWLSLAKEALEFVGSKA
jgi:hypothetical protein